MINPIKNIFNIVLFIWIISIPFKNSIYQISTGLIILSFLFYLIKNKDYEYFKEFISKYKDLLLVSFLIVLSMTISNFINDVSQTKAWSKELSFIYRYIFVFFILLYFYSKDFFSKKMLLIFILISLCIQGIDGIYQGITNYDLFKNNYGDFYKEGLSAATFNRNIFGMLMGIGVILSFLIIDKNKTVTSRNTISVILLFIFAFTTLFSYSRAVWVSLFVVLIMWILINTKKINLKHILIIAGFIFILFLLFFNIETLQNRFNLLLEGNPTNRFVIWSHALDLIKQKIFFGWGLESWKIVGLTPYAGTHNSILEVLLNLGFFGFFAFFVLCLIILKEIYFLKNPILFLLVVYFFIDSLFDQSIIISIVFLSILTILMFYIFSNRLNKRNY